MYSNNFSTRDKSEQPQPNQTIKGSIFQQSAQPVQYSSGRNIFSQNNLLDSSMHRGDFNRSCQKCKSNWIFDWTCSNCIRKQEKQLTQEHLNTLAWLKDQLNCSQAENAAKTSRIKELEGQLAKYQQEQQLRKEGHSHQSSHHKWIKEGNTDCYRLISEDYQLAWAKIYEWSRKFTPLIQQVTIKVPSKRRAIADTIFNFERELTLSVQAELKKLPDLMIGILTKAQEEKRAELRHLQDFQQEMFKVIESQEIKFKEESIQFSEERTELMIAPLREDILKGEQFLREIRVLKQRMSEFFIHQLPRSRQIELQSTETGTLQAQQVLETLE